MKKMQDSELRYRRLFEAAQDGILILDAKTGMIEDVNPFLIKMLGYSREEFIKKKLWEVGAFRDIEASQDAFEALQMNEYIRYEDLPLKTKDGRLIQVEFVSNVYLVGNEKVIQCNIRDITKRWQAEEALRKNGELLHAVLNSAPITIFATDSKGVFTLHEGSGLQRVGMKRGENVGESAFELFHSLPVTEPSGNVTTGEEVLKRVFSGETVAGITELKGIYFDNRFAPILDAVGNLAGLVGVATDITESKQAGARIRRQLEHLTALSAIDRVIAANFDIKLSLSEILTHVRGELEVDAADILILNPSLQMLEYGADSGFRNRVIQSTQVRLGEGYAGRVALERQFVRVRHLDEDSDHLLLTKVLRDEGFVCYFGVPLISKGQVKGVLEVFHRSELEPDAEWFDFFSTLAGQTAIALENAMLFESQQRSNQELTLAYDATIEGWSRALDLRDKETEGHSKRVTERAVKLARTFGLSETELIQVRWGALLHDIGKMGVPDSILLKPDSLTEEEWMVMKKHPIFAYELLAPVRYLRLALDIPYCHHERWDGSGYPRSLAGEQIPLTARIFAVVDVQDALLSDRPYRTAWTVDKVRKHIRTLSGTHFDPQVVEAFLNVDS
ncbi:MAG: PAS domain S-box protein [Anaerolineales bacterium]|nr:PAS domain S-box protein [Anaerolineales bacterium]